MCRCCLSRELPFKEGSAKKQKKIHQGGQVCGGALSKICRISFRFHMKSKKEISLHCL